MFGLAWAYQVVGRLDDAASLHEEVLRRRKAKLGLDHPDTLHSMFAVAGSYGLGRLNEAILMHEEALKLRKAKLGPDHPDTLQSMKGLASGYVEIGRLDEAIALSERALKLREAKLGPDHPLTLQMRFVRDVALGRMRLQQRKYAEAEPLLRKILSLWKQNMPNDLSRFHSESLLGESLLGQKKFAEAEPLLIKGYEGMKERETKIPAPLKHQLTEAGERVVRLYDEWGKPGEAAKRRAELARELADERNEAKP
jgi:tetratricopeptide (TPR) repeat protein